MNLIERCCPICGGPNYVDTGRRTREFPNGDPKVVRCIGCGLIYLNPIMSEEDNKSFYNADSQKKFADPLVREDYDEKVRKDDIRRYNMILKHIWRAHRMLDVGSGNSRLVRMIPVATGIDINKERCLRSLLNGVYVVNCDIFQWTLKEDVITMFHLLEHIIDPIPFLNKAREILEHDGKLIIEVPNHNDLLVNLPAYKNFYYQMAHCTYFTPTTLQNLLNKCGFKIVRHKRLQRYSFDNHVNWALTKKPGNIAGLKAFNIFYSYLLRSMRLNDTTFVVCKKA